jgi:hypothetical protein
MRQELDWFAFLTSASARQNEVNHVQYLSVA